jgi:hypothetical protein
VLVKIVTAFNFRRVISTSSIFSAIPNPEFVNPMGIVGGSSEVVRFSTVSNPEFVNPWELSELARSVEKFNFMLGFST